VAGGTINFNKDLIPNKLHSKIGFARATSMVQPTAGGSFMGWEANAKVGYDIGAFLTVEAHAAYMGLGNFYDSPSVNGGRQTPCQSLAGLCVYQMVNVLIVWR
jgi:hypothetical protein